MSDLNAQENAVYNAVYNTVYKCVSEVLNGNNEQNLHNTVHKCVSEVLNGDNEQNIYNAVRKCVSKVLNGDNEQNFYNAVCKGVSKVLNGNEGNSYNTVHKRHFRENITQYSLCVGAGISADIHQKMSGKKYLWNDLVYGVAEEVFKELLLNKDIIACLRNEISQEEKDKLKKRIIEKLQKLCEAGKFLSTDDTMECVEYLKYLIFSSYNNPDVPDDFEAVDNLNENAIALIIYDLFYKKLSSDKTKLIDSIKDLSNTKAAMGNATEERKTIIELVNLIQWLSENGKQNIKVLTYNYDDYLELTLEKIPKSPPDVYVTYNMQTQREPKSYMCELKNSEFSKVYTYKDLPSNTLNKSSVFVHHVHGYVPHYWDRLQMYGELVFSENSYSHMADEIYNWTNLIQAETFSSDRVLFVGFSGVDTNFRRLMRELHKEWHRLNGVSAHGYDKRHTMFMRYDDIIKNVCNNIYNASEIDETTIKFAEQIVLQTISAKNEYFRDKLGIELIWYCEIKEIADVLYEIRNSSL